MLQIFYNGVDITDSVSVSAAVGIDNSGGVADSVDVIFNDTEGLWQKWGPNKNDTIKIIKDGYSTGDMYIDELALSPGVFRLSAVSTPLGIRTIKSRVWEYARFSAIAADVASSAGLVLELYSIIDRQYAYQISQVNESDLAFLNRLCIREGYSLKVSNGKLVIFDVVTFENKPPVEVFSRSQMADYSFENSNDELFSACKVEYLTADGLYQSWTALSQTVTTGSVYKVSEGMLTQSEAIRFGDNILKDLNKTEVTGSVFVVFNKNIAAGSVIEITEVGAMFDGLYFVDTVVHDFVKNKTTIELRLV